MKKQNKIVIAISILGDCEVKTKRKKKKKKPKEKDLTQLQKMEKVVAKLFAKYSKADMEILHDLIPGISKTL